MTATNKLYQRITDRIVKALEAGTLPWRKGWSEGNSAAYGMPHNAVTGRAYRGINVWLLMMEAEEQGFTSTGWVTPNKAKELELDFKGAKTCEVVFWSKSKREVETDDGGTETKTFMWAKSYRVMNLDQCRGDALAKLKGHKVLELPEEIATGDALGEAVSAALEIEIKHGGDRACYSPSCDLIRMPPTNAFNSEVVYRATLLHEATHATGHKSRCDRDLKGRFGTEAYAFEELIAELGSCYIQAALGIDMELPNHASYIKSWLRVLKDDPKAIMSAASMSQKAVDYLLERLDITAAAEWAEAA
ncbi:MAG TPA: zincin-like metallopeptidase domain-containing protein [Woeseiaceae bacterium]|nr:zincin-like metallopeptidase domain-containing protein [Woeseiaceae bacterium]